LHSKLVSGCFDHAIKQPLPSGMSDAEQHPSVLSLTLDQHRSTISGPNDQHCVGNVSNCSVGDRTGMFTGSVYLNNSVAMTLPQPGVLLDPGVDRRCNPLGIPRLGALRQLPADTRNNCWS
jgi:hypothetical protein